MEKEPQSNPSSGEEEARYTTSGLPIKGIYTPEDIKGIDYRHDLGNPGEYPFTRGAYRTGYRNFVWGQRPVLGYGLPEETNQRIKFLLKYGMASPGGMPSYNITADMATGLGYDSDDPRFAQWVGVNGPPTNSIEDLEAILDGIPLEGVYHGVLGYAPNWRLNLLVAMADNRGIPRDKIAGATLSDSLHGPIGEGCHVFPPRACLRLIVDTLKLVTEEMPYFRACDVQAYSSREAGCNAPQEVAFAIADMMEVVNAALALGLDIDDLAPHLTFFFASGSDFFEEIAKFRAARKVWAQIVKERFKAKKERSYRMRMQVKTSGASLTAQHPLLNIARAGFQALAAVFGGASGLNITNFDECFGAVPLGESGRISLLTGKVLEHESGIKNVTDPLGGSYYVESLTKEMEKSVWDYIEKIDEMGGYIAALESGYLQREIAAVNTKYSYDLDSGGRVLVGVNKFQPEEGEKGYSGEITEHDPERWHRIMSDRLRELRAKRDKGRVEEVLAKLREAASGDGYLSPIYIEAGKAYCTIGEVYGVLREVFGEDTSCLVPPEWVG
jgi:methylmalonyl-CoA mutase N-terminal domain/subunit